MRKIMSTALAGIFLGTTMAASVTPAAADPQRDRFIERYYQNNPRDDDYRRWHRDRDRWDRDDYRRWYRDRGDRFDGDDTAAALFGLAAGAIITGAIANSSRAPAAPVVVNDQEWLSYCSNRFRSFDPASGTYLGYDGQRHACVLP